MSKYANDLVAAVAGAMGIGVADFHKLPEGVKDASIKLYSDNVVLNKAVSGGTFRLGIGQKGGLTISGFGAFPHNFYGDQVERFFGWLDPKWKEREGHGFENVRKFMEVNAGKLKTKATAIVDKANS